MQEGDPAKVLSALIPLDEIAAKEGLRIDLPSLMRVMICAKLGGENWPSICDKLGETESRLARAITSGTPKNTQITGTPSIGLECLKLVKWDNPTEETSIVHPSTEDGLYTEFCDKLDLDPCEKSSLGFYIAAASSPELKHHTLNKQFCTYVGQKEDKFRETAAGVHEFAVSKLRDDPDAFSESYASILSNLEFDTEKFDQYKHAYQEIRCLAPVKMKIRKLPKLLTIQENLTQIESLESRCNPSMISIKNHNELKSLREFYEYNRGSKRSNTEEVDKYLAKSAELLETYNNSKFNDDDYKEHIRSEIHTVCNTLRRFEHNPDKLASIGERKLFTDLPNISGEMSIDDLNNKLTELKIRLQKAVAFKQSGMI